jgi:hypothetical protein
MFGLIVLNGLYGHQGLAWVYEHQGLMLNFNYSLNKDKISYVRKGTIFG